MSRVGGVSISLVASFKTEPSAARSPGVCRCGCRFVPKSILPTHGLRPFIGHIVLGTKRQPQRHTSAKEIDHIELYAPSQKPGINSKNFVLCPGKAYDRSPCGTGTSAKLACLYDEGNFREGEVWRQESIVGSVFKGKVTVREGKIYPTITGSAFVNAKAELLLDPRDPFCDGIRT